MRFGCFISIGIAQQHKHLSDLASIAMIDAIVRGSGSLQTRRGRNHQHAPKRSLSSSKAPNHNSPLLNRSGSRARRSRGRRQHHATYRSTRRSGRVLVNSRSVASTLPSSYRGQVVVCVLHRRIEPCNITDGCLPVDHSSNTVGELSSGGGEPECILDPASSRREVAFPAAWT